MIPDLPQADAGAPAAASTARTDRDIYRLTPTVDAGVLAAIAALLARRIAAPLKSLSGAIEGTTLRL